MELCHPTSASVEESCICYLLTRAYVKPTRSGRPRDTLHASCALLGERGRGDRDDCRDRHQNPALRGTLRRHTEVGVRRRPPNHLGAAPVGTRVMRPWGRMMTMTVRRAP